jgi:Mg2+-importing ATPase
MGTSVESGTATAVVVVTGVNTYLGTMAGSITEEAPPTSFDRGLSRFTWLMIQLMAVMVPLVFLINGFTKHDWKSAFFFAMAVAVGLTPEMLPMIVSVCLSKGAIAMSRKKVIVKRLNAIQNFGGMDVLCTDKTGTLTEDRVVLQRHCNVAGRETDEVLLDGYLISHFQTGLKNLLDTAILNSSDFHQQALIEKYKKLDEIPFDFTRRMMSVMVETPEGKAILLTKGAPEEIFHQCSQFELDGKLSPMDPALMKGLRDEYASLSSDGFRVLAVAVKELPGKQSCSKEDERDLVLKGYVAFLDPPKGTAAIAIQALHKHGVGVKILTGDNDLISRKVCRDVGLEPDPMLLGEAVEKMSDAELADAAEKTTLFARLTPAHKQRIVRLLRSKGHVVGFMGDGINDAPALHAADIGISVDTAVDIAKESADLILLEKDLMVLEGGVIEGAKGLREHSQVHSDGSQLQLWKYVQRFGSERLSAVHPDGADSDIDQQHALRLLAGADSHRRGGRRTGGAAAALEHRRDQAVHSLHWTHQLDLRLHHFLRHALPVQVLGSIPRSVISDRLVRRVADDADTHHPHHSHQ